MLEVPGQDIVDDTAVIAVGGDGLPTELHDAADVVLEERRRVHGGEEHPAVDAVAVVHHPALAPAHVLRGLGHSGRDHADVVALDLEVDVVGVGIVVRVAGVLGGNALQEVLPRLPITAGCVLSDCIAC